MATRLLTDRPDDDALDCTMLLLTPVTVYAALKPVPSSPSAFGLLLVRRVAFVRGMGSKPDKDGKSKDPKTKELDKKKSKWPKQWPREILHKDLEAAVVPRLDTVKDARRYWGFEFLFSTEGRS